MLSAPVSSDRQRQQFLCAVAVAVSCLTCERKRESEPGLEFHPKRLELGTVTQNETATHRVELRNSASNLVRLRETSSSSRCRWETPVAELIPGEKVTRSVVCQSDLLGPLREQLSLVDDRPGASKITLDIVGTVEPVVGFSTAFVDLRPEFGKTQSQELRLLGLRAAKAQPRVTSTGGDMVSVSMLPHVDGSPAVFLVSCKGERVGMHAGSLVFETGLPIPASLTVSWGCRVPGTLEVTPSNPYFNLRVSGERATTITAKSSQSGFVVNSVRVLEGPFSATLEKVTEDGSYPITIKVQNRKIPDEARSAAGVLLIQSNDAREPRKEIPLFGFGQVNKVERPDST